MNKARLLRLWEGHQQRLKENLCEGALLLDTLFEDTLRQAFGTSVADVEAYMAENYADYPDENPDSLKYVELDGGGLWSKYYMKEDRWISFFFVDADGKDLTMVSHDFFFPIQFEAIMAELERNGFTNHQRFRPTASCQ